MRIISKFATKPVIMNVHARPLIFDRTPITFIRCIITVICYLSYLLVIYCLSFYNGQKNLNGQIYFAPLMQGHLSLIEPLLPAGPMHPSID